MIHSRYLAAEQASLRVVLTELGRVEVLIRAHLRVVVIFGVFVVVVLSVVGEEDVLASDVDFTAATAEKTC